jgi:hypothetical protein
MTPVGMVLVSLIGGTVLTLLSLFYQVTTHNMSCQVDPFLKPLNNCSPSLVQRGWPANYLTISESARSFKTAGFVEDLALFTVVSGAVIFVLRKATS